MACFGCEPELQWFCEKPDKFGLFMVLVGLP